MRPRTAIIILAIMAFVCILFLAYLYNITNPVEFTENINYQKQQTNQDSTISENILGQGVEKTEAEQILEQRVNTLIEQDLAEDGKIEAETRREIIDMTNELIKKQKAEMTDEEIEVQNQKQADRQQTIDEAIERTKVSQ